MIPRLDSPAWLWPLILLALSLRLWGLQGQSYTNDEVFEFHQARLSPPEIVVAVDGFPPLYSLSLRAWFGAFGGEQSARLLSVLLGCLALPVMWSLSAHLGAARSPFWPTFLLAISPFHIWYSQEARAYSLFFLLGALAIWTCLRALDGDNRRDWLLFGVVSMLGLLTHYWFGLLLVCLGGIVLLERRSWRRLRRPAIAFSTVGLLALPILPLLRQDMDAHPPHFTPSPFHFWELGRTFYTFLAGYSLGPSIRQVTTMSHEQALVSFFPWILLIGSCVGLMAYRAAKSLAGSRYLVRIAVLVVPPVIVCGLVGNLAGIGYYKTYVVWVAAPVLVLLGVGIASPGKRASVRLAVSVLCILWALSLYQRVYDEDYREPDARGVAQYLAAHHDRELPIFLTHEYHAGAILYYLERAPELADRPFVTVNGDQVTTALQRMRDEPSSTGRYWLIYGETHDAQRGGWLLEALLEHDAVVREVDFAGLDLYLVELEKAGGA